MNHTRIVHDGMLFVPICKMNEDLYQMGKKYGLKYMQMPSEKQSSQLVAMLKNAGSMILRSKIVDVDFLLACAQYTCLDIIRQELNLAPVFVEQYHLLIQKRILFIRNYKIGDLL